MRTTSNRETIGVDALLVRAYREKRVDRLPLDPRRLLAARAPGALGSNVLSRGERVDTSCFGAQVAARIRETMTRIESAGDALLAAHDLVLSLDDYFAEDAPGDPLGFTLWTRAGALDAGLALLGAAGDAPRLCPAEIREEADTVVVTPLAGGRLRPVRRIVIAPILVLAGRSGEPPFVSPIEVERERPVMSGKRRVGTRVEYVTPLDVVRRERADYAAWHDALSSLAAGLASRSDLAVMAPAVSARPWEVEAAAAA